MAACSYLNSVRAFRGDLSRCAAPFLLPPVLSRCRSLANAIFSAPFSPPLLFSWPYIPAHTYPPPVPPSSPLLLVHLPPPPLLSSPSPHFSPVLSCPLMSGSVAPADVFFFILPFLSDCIYPPTPNLCSHFAPTPHSNRVRSLTPRPLLSPLCERHHLLFMLSFILPSALNLLYLCSVSVSPLCLPLCFACVARPL